MPNINFNFHHLKTTSSTMEEARNHLQKHPGTYLVVTDEQTKGRGQRGRTWHSCQGNLYMTLVTRISPEITLCKLSLTAGLAIRESIIEHITPAKIKCKWPNDVLINGQKVAGVLIETETINGDTYAIIGIGVNIQHHPDLTTAIKATSLNAHTTHEISNVKLSKLIANNILKIINNPQLDIREYWLAHAYGLNRQVKYQPSYSSAYFEGRFIGLSDDGGCIISGPSGIEIINTSSLIFPENSDEMPD